jgi:hypothetical protein
MTKGKDYVVEDGDIRLTDHRNLEEKDTRLFNTGVSFKLLSMCT